MTEPQIAHLARLTGSKGPEARAAEVVVQAALIGRFRHAPGLGWLAWDGKRWASRESSESRARDAVREFVDQTERAYREEAGLEEGLAVRVAAKVYARIEKRDQAAALAEVAKMTAKKRNEYMDSVACQDGERAEYDRHEDARATATDQANIWQNQLSKTGLSNLLALAADREGILTETTDFDQHHDLLNVQNGVVDLTTGELRPHDPDLLITKVTAGGYYPGREPATGSPWYAALQAAADDDTMGWLMDRLGQSATGHRPDDDVLFVNWGGGSNGKTTVLTAVANALGDYAGTIPHKVLLAADANGHTTELMNFRGLRFAMMEELPEEGRLNIQRIKATVGTAKIKARLMRKDDVEFETTHAFWITSNHRPQVAQTDHGTWRRLVAVPWPWKFVNHDGPLGPGEKRGDRTLRPQLIDNPSDDTLAEIIGCLVAGARRWYQRGRLSPQHPASVIQATAAWREDSDVTLQFLREHLVVDVNACVTSREMFEAFSDYLAEQGKSGWSAATFKARLVDTLESEGIAVSATPEKTTTLRADDYLHYRQDEKTFGRTQQPPAKPRSAKVWRGIRFRMTTDPVRGEHLRAV